MKKRSRKTLIRLLDKACSDRAKERHLKMYGSLFCKFCVFLGKSPQIANQCFHMFSRSRLATRFLDDNCLWSCAGCNIAFEGDTGFKDNVIQWFKDKFGIELFDSLDKLWHTSIPTKDWELAERLKDIKKDLTYQSLSV